MKNNYTAAVDYLAESLGYMEEIWKDPEYPDVEIQIEQALKILRENPEYKGERPKVN